MFDRSPSAPRPASTPTASTSASASHWLRARAIVAAAALAFLLAPATPAAAGPAGFTIPDALTGHAILSCKDLTVAGNSLVTSEGLGAGTTGAGKGHARSNADVVLDGSVEVHGDAIAGPGRTVRTSGQPLVTGQRRSASTAFDCRPIDLASVAASLAAANDNHLLPRTERGLPALSGAAGRTLELSGKDSLVLPAGSYLLDEIKLTGNSRLRVEGPVQILVTGVIDVKGGSHVNLDGSPYHLKLWVGGATAGIASQSSVFGFLYAPAAAVQLAGQSRVVGAVQGDRVELTGGSRVRRVVDDARPSLTVTAPTNGQSVSSCEIPVAGVVSDGEGAVELTVGGAAVTPAADGSFATTTSLWTADPGLVEAVATDRAGNVERVTVRVSIMPPSVVLATPSPGSLVGSRTVDLAGTAGTATHVTVNGVPAAVAGDGSWRLPSFDLGEQDGLVSLALAAHNCGGSATATTVLDLDTLPPVVAIDSPAPGDLFGRGPISVGGSVDDAHLVAVRVGGVVARVDGKRFTAEGVPLVEGENRLVAVAADALGRTIRSAAVRVELDSTAPTATITEPVSGSVVGTPQVTVRGEVSDPNLTRVTVNGVIGTVNGTTFSAVVSLAEGENSLVANAADRAGNEAESPTAIVVLDTRPPVLTLNAAVLPTLTKETAVTVTGTVVEPHLRTVSVNGAIAAVSGSDWVATDVPLVEGDNALLARAIDTLDHTAETPPATVVRDTLGPQVTITEPAAHAQLASRAATVRGTVVDPHLEKVTVRGVEATVSGQTFEATGVELDEGSSAVVARAVDRLGHEASSPPVPVVVDTLPPVIRLDSPQNPLVATPTVDLTGRVEEPHLSAVTVRDLEATVAADGSFAILAVPLVEGVNELKAVARDSFGHEATSEPVLFVLDTAPPELAVTSPVPGEVLRDLEVTIAGTVRDPHLDEVAVNGVLATLDETTGTFIAGVTLQNGANTVAVVAVDRAGNRAELAIAVTVVLDSEPPLLTLDEPTLAAGACLPTGALRTLGGLYRDENPAAPAADAPAAVVVEVVDPSGARRTYPGTIDATAGRWSAAGVDLGATDGTAQVRVTATDAYGNRGSALVALRLDAAPPVVRLLLDGAPFLGAAAGAAPPAGASPTLIGRGITAAGAVEDGAASAPPPAVLTLDGAAYAAGTAIVAEGQHLLVATATDCAGRTTATHALFVLDTTAPALRSSSPAVGQRLTTAPTSFSGVSDPDLARATVGGRAATVTGAGTFAVAPFDWREGPNEVAIELQDRAGHRARHRVAFEVKTVPLSVQVLEGGAPLAPGQIFLRPVRPEARPSDSAARVTATLDGAPFVSGSGITRSGSYHLVATASDDWGRTARAEARFTVDLGAPPQVAITTPLDGAVIGEARVRVAGTVSGDAATVTVNGVVAALHGDTTGTATWEVPALPLEPDGLTGIAAIARDRRGRTASDSLTVSVASGAPQVLILEPADGTTTNRSLVDVAGAVVGGRDRSADGTVTVQGQPVTLLPDGTFRALDVPLAAGSNEITVAVIDGQARTGTASVTVTADFTSPTIALLADGRPLLDGATFGGPIALAVEVADDAMIGAAPSIRLNGAPYAGAAVPRTEIAVADSGGYVVAVAVTDAAGNVARAERSFVLSAGGCSLDDVSPPAGSGVDAATVTLVGRAAVATTVKVRVPQPGGGTEEYAAAVADGTFHAGDVPLPVVGQNALDLICTGSGGSSRSQPHPIERLATGAGPVVDITSPESSALVSASAVSVAGTVTTGAVTVNGLVATVQAAAGADAFQVASMPLAEGPNPILARGVDAAGRTGEDRVVVERDSTAPRLQITRPDNRTRLGVAGSGPATVDVSGAVDLTTEPNLDHVVVTATVGGVALGSVVATVDPATGAFTAAGVPLDGGVGTEVEQTLTASAIDSLGQAGSSSVVVTLDPSGPAIVLHEPADLTRFAAGAVGPVAARGEVWAAPGAAVSINGVDLDPAALAWGEAAADGRRHVAFTATVNLPTTDGPFGVIARVTDLQGRLAQDRRLLYRDTQGPRVVELVPADGAAAVDGNALLLALFSEPVRQGSLAAADGLALVRIASGQPVVGSTTAAGHAVAFAPGAALTAGEGYRLRAGFGITDLAGNPLVEPAEARFTVAASRAAAAPVLAPAPPATLCASKLTVTGTAAPSATIKVRLGGLVFTGFADGSGAFSVTVPVSGSGYQLLTAWALDPLSGEKSPDTTAVLRIDCQSPTVVEARLERATGVVQIHFSEAMLPATLAVGDATAAIRLADADAPTAYQAGVVSFTDERTVAVQLDTAAAAWWRERPVRLQVGPPAADAEGNAMAAVYETVFFPGGGDLSGGFLFGEAYDDSTGRPLGGAAAALYPAGVSLPGTVPVGEEGSPLTGAVTDGRGRFVLTGEVPAGRYVLVVAGQSTNQVYRRLSLRPGTGQVPFDSRLTPLAVAAGAITPAHGGAVEAGAAGGAGSGLRFVAEAGALPGSEPVTVRLTALSQQGLPDFLPLGWTPAAAAELRLEQATVAGEIRVALPEQALWTSGLAALELPLPGWVTTEDELYAARYEAATGRWIGLPLPERLGAPGGGSPGRVRVEIGGPGTVAVVVPDAVAPTRPPALPGPDEPLVGVERPAAVPELLASLALDPPVVGPTGRARARVVARSVDGAAPWPAGLAVQAYLEERLVLAGGGELLEAPFAADLVLYRPRLSAEEQGDAAVAAAGAMEFAVSPSAKAAQVLLEVGWENIRVFPFPEEVERGPLVGPEGGGVDSADGVELTIPEGALAARVPVAVELLATAELAALPAVVGYDTVAAVRVDLSGATLARPATLSLPVPAATPADSPAAPRVVVAELVAAPVDGRGAFAQVVARTRRQGHDAAERLLAAPETGGMLPLDGLVREGTYLVLAAHEPLGFATGFVHGGNSVPVAASRVTADGLGTADLTGSTGRYAVPVPAGTQRRVVGRHPALDERAEGTIAALAAGEVTPLDLSLVTVPPRVLSTTPADGATAVPLAAAVSALFSEALDASTVTSSTLRVELLDSTGVATGVLVAGSVSLVDGVRVVFTPSRPLLPGRRFRAVLAGGVADAGGAIHAGGPVSWSFTTSATIAPGGQVDPAKFHLRVPAGGVAEVYGDPGALPGTLPGQTPWAVSPEIEGPLDPQRNTFQGRADGSFSGTVGHPPGFPVELGSRIWVKVFDPAGTLAAEFRVGPFTTPDGLGFVAPAGEAATFRSAQGHVVEVPAAAFAEATLVTVRNLDPATVGVPTPRGLGLGAFVAVDFAGEARETLRLHVPAPAAVPDGAQVFVGRPTGLPWGRRLQVLSVGGVLSRDGGRFLSNDPSLQPEPGAAGKLGPAGTAAAAKLVTAAATDATCQQAREEGLSECFLESILTEFRLRSQAAFYYEQGTEWSLLVGQSLGVSLGTGLEAISNALADAWVYLAVPNDWDGKFVLPVLSEEPLELVRRDVASGWELGRESYDPVAGSDDIIDVGFLDGAEPRRPLLIDARPFQIFRLATPPKDESTRFTLEIELRADQGGSVVVAGVEDFPVAAGTSVAIYDLSPITPEEPDGTPLPPVAGPTLEVCEEDDSWTTAAAEGSRDLLVVVTQGSMDPASLARIELQFDQPLADVTGRATGEVVLLEDLGPSEGCGSSSAGGYPKTLAVSLEQAERGSRIAIVPAAALPSGHRFRLALRPEAIEVETGPGESAGYWETAPTEFHFTTREVPGEPIAGMPAGPALGSTSVARDLLMFGNLLLVASETGDLVAIDTSKVTDKEGLRRYALENRSVRGAARALATDGHNRIFYAGLFGSLWTVKALRLEDILAADATCVGAPDWAQGLPCFDGVAGAVRLAYALGSASGTTASEWLAAGTLPEATPMELAVLAQDERGATLELAEFARVYQPGGSGLGSLEPDAEGIYTIDVQLTSTWARSRANLPEPSLPPDAPRAPAVEEWRETVCEGEKDYDRFQRVTVENLTTGQSWSADLENEWPDGSGNGGGVLSGVRARRGDDLRVRYNLRALGHAALLGSGVTVVDLNRGYRLPLPEQRIGVGQCGRRLGKFEGQQIEMPSCVPAGAVAAGISMTPAVVTHSAVACDADGSEGRDALVEVPVDLPPGSVPEVEEGEDARCRGEGFIDVYSPLQRVGVVHARSTVEAPGGVMGGRFEGEDEPDALQLADLAACIQKIGEDPVSLRDVALANDVEWVRHGIRGELDGTFQPPPEGTKPERVRGELLFVSLGTPGVYVFDVSARSLEKTEEDGGEAGEESTDASEKTSLVGRLAVAGHSVHRLQVDAARGLLFAGGTDAATGKPVIDVWDIGGANAAPGLDGEATPVATLHAPWSTNQLGIDSAGTGLVYSWDPEKGAIAVPFEGPSMVFSGLYRRKDDESETDAPVVQRATARFVPLGVPMASSLEQEEKDRFVNEEKGTAAFKVRVALPGALGPELTAKVQSLRMVPAAHHLHREDLGPAVQPPGGPGWPENEVVVRLRRIGKASDEPGGDAAGDGGALSGTYQLYESVETVLLIADPRARSAYRRQDADSTETADEAAQCRRCQWPAYLPDPEDPATDPDELEEVEELLAGSAVRAFLFAAPDAGEQTREATEKAIQLFADLGEKYPAPAGAALTAGAADSVPSPVQASLAEPAQGAAVWDAGEAGVSVALPGGELLLAVTDRSVAARAIPFTVARTYRSGTLGYGPLGSAGWSATLFAHLRELPLTGEVEYHDGTGRVWRFHPRTLPEPPEGSEEDEAGSYYPPVGVYLRLQKLSGGLGWRLMGPHRDVARFDAAGRLVELADRHQKGNGEDQQGSRMELLYDPFGQLVSVVDDMGRRYDFEYFDDPRPEDEGGDGKRYGLLRKVEDFAEREVRYEFDEERRLTDVELPPVTNPVQGYESFSYPEEKRPTITYAYDPSDGGVDADEGARGAVLHGEFARLRLGSFSLPEFVPGWGLVPRARFEYDRATGRLRQVHFPATELGRSPNDPVSWAVEYSEAFPAERASVRAPWNHAVDYVLEDGRVTTRREDLEVEGPGGALPAQPVSTTYTYAEDGRLKATDRADGSQLVQCYADGVGGPGCEGGGEAEEGADRLLRGNVVRTITAAVSGGRGTADYESVAVEATYQEENLLTAVKDGEGRAVDLAVPQPEASDSAGFVAEGISSRFTYDRHGRVTESRAGGAGGPVTRIGYGADSRGRSGAGFARRIDAGGALWKELDYDEAGNLEEIRTSQGTTERAQHDDWDRVVRSVTGISESGEFAPVGVAGCSLGEGAIVERAFDAAGHVVRERRLQDFVQQLDGPVDCRMVETRYSYNAREQLVSVEQTHLSNPHEPGEVIAHPSLVRTLEYDEHGRLTREIANATGHLPVVTAYTYDEAGRVATVRSGDEGARRVGYDELSRVVAATDGHEGVWRGQFDAWGRLYREELPTGAVVRRRFDRAGNPLHESVFDRDPEVSVDARLVSEVRSHFTSFGALERTIETLKAGEGSAPAELRLTERVFDEAGRVVEVWSGPPSGADLEHVDRSLGRREASIAYEPETGRVATEVYGGDAATPALHGVRYTYEPASKAPWPDIVTALESVPGEGLVETATTRFRRDALGRPIEERRSDGSVLTSLYDRSGGVIQARTGAGTQAATRFDGAGRAIEVLRPNGRGSTAYAYDFDGVLLREVASAGAEAAWTTAYGYDATGRVTDVTYADASTERLIYNVDSTVDTRRARDGVLVTYTYDAANRVVAATPAVGEGAVPTRVDGGDAFAYDPLSRPTLLQRSSRGHAGYDPSLAVRYPAYDLASRPTAEVVGGRQGLEWRYDLWSRPVEVALPQGVGRPIPEGAEGFRGFVRRYDTADRLVDVASLGAAGLSATPLGATWDWGGAQRLYGMTTRGALATASRYGYHGGAGPQLPGADAGAASAWKLGTLTWGSAGGAGPTSAPATAWGAFGFGWRGHEGSPSDGAKLGRQVLGVGNNGGDLFAGLGWSWSYDGGVRLSSARAGEGNLGGVATAGAMDDERFRFGYGAGDQLQTIVRESLAEATELPSGDYGRITARDGVAFTYDGAGRRLTDDRFDYVWDWRGQLVEVTVKDAWPSAGGEDDASEVTPWAGHRVRYDYDALGRLTRRELLGRPPEGGTDAQRPWIELREYVWEVDGLAAEVSWTTPDRHVARWRKTYVPGPSGLDDAVQVVVEIGDQPGNPFAGSTRTYTLLRDELGTIVGLVAEDEGGDPEHPPVPVRYRYTPFGEPHAELGPELLRARFDADMERVRTAGGTTVEQVTGDADAAAAGAVELGWSAEIDLASVGAGIRVERLAGEGGTGWVVVPADEIVVGDAVVTDGTLGTGGGPRFVVMARGGWARGSSYRVRLEPALRDSLGRSFGRQETLEWRVPEAVAEATEPPPVIFDKRFAPRFEAWEAAGDPVQGRFPGGQTSLFQGLWTDPVTGMGYARARWYDARNASWLSEDPLLDVDSPNLYAFVGHQPNMGTDPLGLLDWREWKDVAVNTLRDTAEDIRPVAEGALDFGAGVGQGLSAGYSLGTAPSSAPSASDTRLRRVGQSVGSGLAFIQGGTGTMAGGAATGIVCTADVASAPTVVGPMVLTPACVGTAALTAYSAGVSVASLQYMLRASGTDMSGGSEGSQGEAPQRLRDERGRYAADPDAPLVRHSRGSEYPHQLRPGVREEVLSRHRDAQGNIIDPETGQVIPPDQITVDHRLSVVQHWNMSGYNMSKAQRTEWFNDLENLTVMPRGPNSSRGATMEPTFRQDLGPGYRR